MLLMQLLLLLWLLVAKALSAKIMKKLVLGLAIALTLIGVSVYVAYATSTPAVAAGCPKGGC